jgi:nucleotide-binding universal stress UspA family protein
MFQRVLVPLDGSGFAEQALPWARVLARRAGAGIELVRGHVLYALRDPAASWCPFDPAEETRWRQEEQLYLDNIARRLTVESPLVTSTALIDSLAADAILARVEASQADLVVMTTHGRGLLSRFFVGSVADELVRRAPVPILLVRPRELTSGPFLEPALENVLVPLDGSALAEQALGPALNLAGLMGARCTLLRIVELSGEASQEAETAQAHMYLNGLARRLREQPVPIEVLTVAAVQVADAIVRLAQASDLIALATHGRGGVQRLLLGSVADKVIRASCNPVLVYRPGASSKGGTNHEQNGEIRHFYRRPESGPPGTFARPAETGPGHCSGARPVCGGFARPPDRRPGAPAGPFPF